MKIFIGILIGLIIIALIVALILLLKKISLVKENSVKFQKLEKLNDNFEFIKNCKKSIKVTNFVTKKEEISKLDIDEVMENLFFDNTNNILVNFESIFKNEEDYLVYDKKYSNIKDKTGKDFIKLTNLSDSNFKFIENKLFKMYKQKPILKTKIKLSIKFDGLDGNHEYKKSKTYSYNDIKKIYSSKKGK